MSILIKSAIIVDSKSNFNFKKKDIYIKDGVIIDIADSINSKSENFLDDSVKEAINRNALYCLDNDDKSVYSHYLFNENIRVIPILDDSRKVVSVAYFGEVNFKISKRSLSYEDNEIYLIAEIGVNHNGDYKEALKLIDYIAESKHYGDGKFYGDTIDRERVRDIMISKFNLKEVK